MIDVVVDFVSCLLSTDHGSCLMLHTVNAQHISSVECEELILCLACSTAPEGRSVNVIAGGLSNGVIRYVFGSVSCMSKAIALVVSRLNLLTHHGGYS